MVKDKIILNECFDYQIRRYIDTSILQYVYELNNVMTFMFFRK